MIRRGFWLIVGAAGGIIGYRRASSATRQVAEALSVRRENSARPEKPGAVRRHWATQAIRFTRDVREGMDLYLSRHERESRPTLDPSAESRRS